MSGNKNENLVPSGGRGKIWREPEQPERNQTCYFEWFREKVQGNQELDDAVEQGNRKSLMGYGD